MPEYQINIRDLFRDAFGDIGLRRYSGFNFPSLGKEILYGDIPTFEVPEGNPESVMGTPVFMPVQFRGGTYEDRENGEIVEREFEDYRLPDASLVEFNKAKNIVKTKITDRDGTVKEFISDDDWRIRIRGIVANVETNEYPEDQVRALRAFDNIPVAIDVEGKLFEMLEIYKVVVERVELPALEGHQNVQPFVMTMLSDDPVEIQKLKGL